MMELVAVTSTSIRQEMSTLVRSAAANLPIHVDETGTTADNSKITKRFLGTSAHQRRGQLNLQFGSWH